MIVYRVERADGSGPYTSGYVPSTCYDDHRHPDPCFDNMRLSISELYGSSWKFGFIDRPQCRDWFNWHEVSHLMLREFRLAIYDVPPEHIRPGNKQVAFRYDKATLLRHESLAPVIERIV